MVQSASKTATPSGTASSASPSRSGSTGAKAPASTTTSPVLRPVGDHLPLHVAVNLRQATTRTVSAWPTAPARVTFSRSRGMVWNMLAEAHGGSAAGYGLGTLVAALAAVLFAVGAVLQHEAAADSTV